jgi:hypothetical protein
VVCLQISREERSSVLKFKVLVEMADKGNTDLSE